MCNAWFYNILNCLLYIHISPIRLCQGSETFFSIVIEFNDPASSLLLLKPNFQGFPTITASPPDPQSEPFFVGRAPPASPRLRGRSGKPWNFGQMFCEFYVCLLVSNLQPHDMCARTHNGAVRYTSFVCGTPHTVRYDSGRVPFKIILYFRQQQPNDSGF